MHDNRPAGPLWAGILLGFCVLAQPASAAPVHIVALGDSATAGYLVAPGDAYPAQLQTALRKKHLDVTVENAGRNGETTAGALARFDEAIPPGTDIAIVELGTNDLRQHVPAARMRSNLAEIVRSLKTRSIAVLLIGLGSLDVSEVARAERVPYAQWRLPKGQFRARDGAHFNAQGYAVLVARLLPQVEALIAQAGR